MSLPAGGGGSYPGINLPVSQLLDAVKRKLQASAFVGRIATTMSPVEVDSLEGDALEVLLLIRTIKNNFAPINRMPLELLSQIPRHWDENYMEKNLIAMTHVCQSWRKILTGYSPLWTRLTFTHLEKTRVYLQRSRSSPLEIDLQDDGGSYHLKEAFLLIVPHISRISSITMFGGDDLLRDFTRHFSCPVPSLKHLNIDLATGPPRALSEALFAGDIPTLHTLCLSGITPHLPWKNLQNLTTFLLRVISRDETSVTRLLDIFENAPRLNDVEIYSIPGSSDAPARRVVSLSCLKSFVLITDLTRASILLNHLCIPAGASLHLEFDFDGDESPLPGALPKASENLQNIAHITSAYVRLDDVDLSIRLTGPSGELLIYGYQEEWSSAMTEYTDRIFHSLDYFPLSRIQKLGVTYELPIVETTNGTSSGYILDAMKDLHTLFINECNHMSFILTLDPNHSPSKRLLCPKLENLVFHLEERESLNVRALIQMVKERASKGAELRSITVTGRGEFGPEEEVRELRGYVAVDRRAEDDRSEWDSVPEIGNRSLTDDLATI